MNESAKILQSAPLLAVRKYGDPVLQIKAKPVDKIDEDVRRTLRSMFSTMYAEPGIGLAAPQVGISRRMMVVDVAPDGKSRPLALINPKIVEKKGRIRSEEGCLSFPGVTVNVPRAATVRVTALNESGFPLELSADGLLSRCLQHEMDHLDGILMIDHAPLPKRWKIYWEIRRRKKRGTW